MEEIAIKNTALLYVVLVLVLVFFCGCGKLAVEDPVYLPSVDSGSVYYSPEKVPAPVFGNGDIVRYKMLGDKQGMMMSSNHEYISGLKTWYCIVDFYPSSALIHFDFSGFDNYERRYVYEFELELVKKYHKKSIVPARWQFRVN